MSIRFDDEHKQSALAMLAEANPIRRIAESLNAGHSVERTDGLILAGAIVGRSWLRRRERFVARWLLGRITWTPDQREAILAVLSAPIGKALNSQRINRIGFRWFTRTAIAALIFWLACTLLYSGMYSSTGIADYWAGLLTLSAVSAVFTSPLTLPLSCLLDRQRVRRVVPLIEALGELKEPMALSVLAKCLLQPSLRDHVAPAFTAVAQGLSAEHYGGVPPDVVPNLCRALGTKRHDLQLSILRALEAVGDGRAILAVEGIARYGADSGARLEAIRILPVLQQRADLARSTATLLRPVDGATQIGDVLLRPAGGHDDDNQETLLRALDA
jgi:hypothetical protein